jgi:hypothetical protein
MSFASNPHSAIKVPKYKMLSKNWLYSYIHLYTYESPLSIYSRQIIMLIYTNKKHKYSASTVRVHNKVFITSPIRVIL